MLTKATARALAATLIDKAIPKRELRDRRARALADELATQMVLRLAEILRATWERLNEERDRFQREHAARTKKRRAGKKRK